jgi:hypothetical protein
MEPEKMSPEELEQFIHRELRALPPRPAPAGFAARFQAKLEARHRAETLSPAQVEQLVHRELQALPLRRAPRTLEARVLAAIEHQAVVPWYHKSWSHWPQAVRAAFLVVATGVAGGIVTASYAAFYGVEDSGLAAEAGARLGIFTTIFHVCTWAFDLGARVVASIPPLWLYGGLAFVAAMYATFFGLSAAAYRSLTRSAN